MILIIFKRLREFAWFHVEGARVFRAHLVFLEGPLLIHHLVLVVSRLAAKRTLFRGYLSEDEL